MSESAEKGTLYFRTNVQLKSIIGKDLINDDNIAILELVKNSFDANAKRVEVEFINLKSNDDPIVDTFSPKTSKLVIQDDGVGMNLTDISDKWLNIAYSEKKTNNRQHSRMMAGAKGVGRFSCDRLGEYLNLYSKTDSSGDYVFLRIDWKKFELDDQVNTQIQSIGLDYEILKESDIESRGIKPFVSGVRLEIIKLRRNWASRKIDQSKWNVNRFIELKKYLEKLINPNQAFEKNDFGVFLKASEFKDENYAIKEHQRFIGQIKSRIFDKLNFKATLVESWMINDGKEIITELRDKGDLIFRIQEKNEFYPHLKNVRITLYYLNPYAKAFFTKQTGIRAVDYGSIFLFVNGFRVPPYGEEGNDWLGLDQRKAQGYSRFIGLREYVGRIEILDRDNNFQVISSREGIVRNESFFKLTKISGNKSYFFKTLRRLERYVVDGLKWDSIPLPDVDKISEIEKKIISGETQESDLNYREGDEIKQRRTYDLIHSIINAKPENVIHLYINESLILQKVAKEKKKSEKEFKQLLDDFENKKIDPDTLNRILKQKAGENKSLDKQIKEFSKYSIDEITSSAVINLQLYKENVENQRAIILDLKRELEEVKGETTDIKNELNEAKSQNLFLKSIKSQEFEDVVNLMHHIGISTSTIQNYIGGVVTKLEKNIQIDIDELKKVFGHLNYELNKIYSISKFATKANFKMQTKESSINLVAFFEQYILNIIKPFLPKKTSLVLYDYDDREFVTKFKPIEFTIIIDNLINNARKSMDLKSEIKGSSYSQKIEVFVNRIREDELCIILRDNGQGISNDMKDKVFDYGFTTTNGSGLGLTHVKELTEKMGGKIELNSTQKNGAEFILTFIKKTV